MKQFLLISTSALVASVALTSCQQEEQSCTQIAKELTELLKNVTDHDSAKAAAPRAAALMKRLVNALGRPVDISGSSLHASSLDEGAELKKALEDLTEQIARVYVSYPSTSADGEIDRDRLIRAVGVHGVIKRAEAGAELKKGEAYLAEYKPKGNFSDDPNNSVPSFERCFGCKELEEALDVKVFKDAKPVESMFKIDGEADAVATPEYVEPAAAPEAAKSEGEGEDDAAESTDEDTAEESTEDTTSEETSEETTEEDSGSDFDVSVDDVSVDIGGDEETAEDEETTEEETMEEESTDEEPVVEETTDEEPAEEETTDEEPAEEETSDEEPVEDEESEEEIEDVETSADDFDLDI